MLGIMQLYIRGGQPSALSELLGAVNIAVHLGGRLRGLSRSAPLPEPPAFDCMRCIVLECAASHARFCSVSCAASYLSVCSVLSVVFVWYCQFIIELG